jgi:hypothetical protein
MKPGGTATIVRLLIVLGLVMSSGSVITAQPINVTIQQLTAAPKKFNGNQVRVIGYYDQTQEHSPFIARDARSAHSTAAKDIDALIFVDLKPSELTNPAIKVINHGYIRLVGTFQYKSTQGKSLGPDTKNPGRFIWESSVGFGWGGIYSMQITKVKEFTPIKSR